MKITMSSLIVVLSLMVTACSGDSWSPPSVGPSPVEVATPAPTRSTPQTVTMIGAGDIGWCGLDGAKETANIINNQWADVVFTLGDNAYPDGSTKNFAECYDPFWGKFRGRTKPAIGNHEYNSSEASGYFNYFLGVANYYSYELGNWHIVVLDTERGGNSQLNWLRSDLERHKGQPMLIQMHRPLVSSGPNGDNPDLRAVWDILEKYKVKVVLAGHDHLYERFAKIDSNGNPSPAGIRQFIVGTGGAKLYSFASVKPGSEFKTSVWGVLKLTLNSKSYSWSFISVDQGTLDSGTESIS